MNTHVTDLYEHGKFDKSWTFYRKFWKDLNEKYIQWNLYKPNPEQTRNLSKPETCLNQTSSEVLSYQFQCILILYKPNTCINQTNPSVRKEFGLDRLHCNWTNYNKEKRGCMQCHAKDTPTRFKFEQDNQTKVEIQQKWKYKKTFNSSGQSCVSNMKVFCPVVAETSLAQIVCRQTDNRLTWWLQYAPSYKWGYNS